jgi:glycine/D-amino acid oxidase-like deaminating enzyme
MVLQGHNFVFQEFFTGEMEREDVAIDTPPSTIVIIGGGIIGVASAYFLTTHQHYLATLSRPRIVIIETSSIAGGASGRAGGLLAEWAYPECLEPLSWRLHAEIAEKLNGKERYGYRFLDGCDEIYLNQKTPPPENEVSEYAGERAKKRAKTSRDNTPEDVLTWMDRREIVKSNPMAPGKKTAQVIPKMLVDVLVEEITKAEVDFIYGKVTKVLKNDKGQVCGVEYLENAEKKTIACSKAIVAAGAWSPSIYQLPIVPVRVHSIVLPATLPPRAIFASMPYRPPTVPSQENGSSTKAKSKRKRATLTPIVAPEIYPRGNGTTYICGEGDRVPLPETTALVQPAPERIFLLRNQLSQLTSALDISLQPLVEQACFIPLVETDDDHFGPIIGNSSKVNGLVIASGHTAWGIMNSLATGKLVSEIVWDGKASSADITSLDPVVFGV